MAIECFHDVVWHHSYVVIDPDGVVHTFCIYSAPDEARLRAHAAAFGGHHRRMEALQGVSDILGIGLVGAGRRTHEVHEEDRDEHALLPGAFRSEQPGATRRTERGVGRRLPPAIRARWHGRT